MKHVMLLFLSPIKTRSEGDRVIISETPYKNVEGAPTKTTNESAIRHLIQDEFAGDVRVIRRCVEHGYMQQALMLYTERL